MRISLSALGVSSKETKIYLAGLKLGASLHKQLAEESGVKRSTLYLAIPNLIEKGLFVETIRGKRKYLVPQDIQPLLAKQKQCLLEIEKSIPAISFLLETKKNKPTIMFYEGMQGIKKIWSDHLKQKQAVLEFISIENIHPDLNKYIKQYYIIERARKKIPLKMLVSGSTTAGIFKVKTNPYEYREVKTIDGKLFPIPLGMNIYGDTVSITLHREESEPIGLIIRSKEIAITMRSLFNFIWEKASL